MRIDSNIAGVLWQTERLRTVLIPGALDRRWLFVRTF